MPNADHRSSNYNKVRTRLKGASADANEDPQVWHCSSQDATARVLLQVLLRQHGRVVDERRK